MDPITHGITGALLGKAFFSEKHGRAATFAATLGAVFPDVDVVWEFISRDPLAILKYHRGFTHSFLGLPLFAAPLASLTRVWRKRQGKETPSWRVLAAIYGVGIASHILLDAMTSFGTRIWSPVSSTRVSWDLLFIIDFAFTAIVLIPQAAAWAHRDHAAALRRAAAMWLLFSLAAFGVWRLAAAFSVPFSLFAVLAIVAILAAVFFLPLWDRAGESWGRAGWCRGGVAVMGSYILLCGVAHAMALDRVKTFAATRHIATDHAAALPLPPSLLSWSGLIRTTEGVYAAHVNLHNSAPPEFLFLADSPRDEDIARAQRLPGVRTFLWFARFPLMRETKRDSLTFVEFRDVRFEYPGRRNPVSFTYRVVLDATGKPIHEGWAAGQSSGAGPRRSVPRRRHAESGNSDPR